MWTTNNEGNCKLTWCLVARILREVFLLPSFLLKLTWEQVYLKLIFKDTCRTYILLVSEQVKVRACHHVEYLVNFLRLVCFILKVGYNSSRKSR